MAAPTSLSPNFCGITFRGEVNLLDGERNSLENHQLQQMNFFPVNRKLAAIICRYF